MLLKQDYVINLILVTYELVTYESKEPVTGVTALLVPYEGGFATAVRLRAGHGP